MKFWPICASLAGLVAGLGHAQPAANSGQAYRFREPGLVAYQLVAPSGRALAAAGSTAWLTARREGSRPTLELGRRVVLHLTAPASLEGLLAGTGLKLSRRVSSNLFILEAPGALEAARQAERFAQLPGVTLSHPVRRRAAGLFGPYAPMPNDPYFSYQWHLENRDPLTGASVGPDLNARAAWPWATGAGTLIAIGDDGIELTHPDLAANATNSNHFNFVAGTTNGLPVSAAQVHATAVAGLAAAVGNNHVGIAGAAPEAQLASWVIFDTFDTLTDEEHMMDMFQYRSNVVSVQNHSWGNAGIEQLALTTLEDLGISNAVHFGRSGLGVVMVRANGNLRTSTPDGSPTANDGNDDGYAQDPRTIAVGAVRVNGQPTSFSTPGANVLTAAFSADPQVEIPGGFTNYPGVTTTDRQGALGYNHNTNSSDQADYVFGASGLFPGTSASAPQIAGVCALILSANPALGYRDVQQILLLSCRHFFADPDLQTNGAGLLVSHNTGFGIPDAGQAVALARLWSNRPPAITVAVTNSNATPIPDDGLRVVVETNGVTALSVGAWPGDGFHQDDPTPLLPLVDVGQALNPITNSLAGAAALIRRGVNYFVQKIDFAAAAGATFAVIYNHTNGNERVFMNGADIEFAPIPCVFLSQNDGEAVRALLAQAPGARAQIRTEAARLTFVVTNTLICEHVAVHIFAQHPRRADLRLTLVSPAGTRSILGHFNQDLNSALGEWTYYSTHHYFESAFGTWQLEVSDERLGVTGSVSSAELRLEGVPIQDEDHDGLDDGWELANFGSLRYGPKDDPDGDGYSNLLEYLLGSDPLAPDSPFPFRMDLSPWNTTLARLSWPGTSNYTYSMSSGSNFPLPPVSTTVTGSFPVTEQFVSLTNQYQFYQLDRAGIR